MRINSLLETGAFSSPWPFAIDGKQIGGGTLGRSQICERNCPDSPACAVNPPSVDEQHCNFGLSYFSQEIGANKITVYGLRGPENSTKFNPYNKEGLKGRSVTQDEIGKWFACLRAVLDLIETEFIQRQSEMLEPLHDPIKLASTVNKMAAKLIERQGTHSFEEAINRSPQEIKSLFKASELLNETFELLTIYFNPAAATYGKLKSISLHGLITKLINILQDRTRDNGHRVYLDGESHRNIFVYNSFKIIPFALISNAIKYCLDGDVHITLVDRNPIIEVRVESTGPLIEPDEERLIFEKRGRGRWAARVTDGRGVGLYLSQLIANAHGISIKVASRKTGAFKDGIPLATNMFSFEIAPSRG